MKVYQIKEQNQHIVLLVLYLFLFFLASFMSLKLGSVKLTYEEIRESFTSGSPLPLQILELRTNNLLKIILAGSILALSGTVLQKILKNPLADPFILGISSGGAFFSSLFILLQNLSCCAILINNDFDVAEKTVFSFLGCALSFILIFIGKSKIKNIQDDYIFPIIGIVLNSFFSSLTLMISALAKPEQLIEIHNFLIGNLQDISNKQIFFLALPSTIIAFIIIKNSNKIRFLMFGDEFARSLGTNPVLLRNFLIFLICFIVSIVVSIAGIIGFIGLIVPHIIKKIHRTPIFLECILSMILGATVLIIADIFSRTLLAPAQIPVGVFTAIIGSPILAFLLIKRGEIKA